MRSLKMGLGAVAVAALAGILAFSACSAPAAKLKTGPSDPALVKRLADANNRFGFRLFAELQKGQAGKNVFFSPYSVSSALAMTYNGASGDTQKAMAKALELGGMTLPDMNRAYAQLATQLRQTDPNVRINVANSLWANKNLTFKPAFLRDNTDYFGAEVANLDFGNPTAAANRINGWVNMETSGKIDKLVKAADLNYLMAMVLVNAIYFQGDWTYPFDKDFTQEGSFTLADGSLTQALFMRRSGHKTYLYLRGEGFEAVRLPYGKERSQGNRYAMYIFLPDKNDGLTEWMKGLNAETWNKWLTGMSPQEGSVILPKFKMQYETEMKKPLTALGMGIAFNPGKADFRRMIDDHVFISRVDHKAILEVDEKGSTAAAATSVEAAGKSAVEFDRYFHMLVDHPFFCAIRDENSGEILFMGAVYNPKA